MKLKTSPEKSIKEIEPALKALKDHYNQQLVDFEDLVIHARSQLQHIDALMDQPVGSKVPEIAAAPAKVAPAPRATKATKIKSEKPAKKETKTAIATVKVPKGKTGRGSRRSSLELQPNYKGNTLLDAIAQVLQEQKGKSVNAEQVVSTLYGDLNPELYKIAKDRVTKNLSKGKINNQWERVPNQMGHYTFSLASLNA